MHNYHLSASSSGEHPNSDQHPSLYTFMHSVTPSAYIPQVNYPPIQYGSTVVGHTPIQYGPTVVEHMPNISFNNLPHYPQDMGFQNSTTLNISPSLAFLNSQETHYQANTGGQFSMSNVNSSGSTRLRKRSRK